MFFDGLFCFVFPVNLAQLTVAGTAESIAARVALCPVVLKLTQIRTKSHALGEIQCEICLPCDSLDFSALFCQSSVANHRQNPTIRQTWRQRLAKVQRSQQTRNMHHKSQVVLVMHSFFDASL